MSEREEIMNYHNITKDDMLNGDGLRVVLWTAGCTHRCKNCQNPITWDVDGGIPFDSDAKMELFQELEKDYVSGLTLSGGDPLHPANCQAITDLAKEVRSTFPNKTIWLYTGFEWEEIYTLEIMQYVDVVVDGPYKEEQRNTLLEWRGSANQRVIDVPASLRSGSVVLHV